VIEPGEAPHGSTGVQDRGRCAHRRGSATGGSVDLKQGGKVANHMAGRKHAPERAQKSASSFTPEERAAARERVRELRSRARAGKENGENDVLAKIAEMKGTDRVLAERIHALVKANAPGITSRTWYGMPAYAKDDQVVLFFKCAAKFKTRYATLGFSDEAKLDEGHLWPTEFALTEIAAADEAKIAALVRKAVA
jgi:uncharacterized protein YdhG (YjbR/CyaY superfamily)